MGHCNGQRLNMKLQHTLLMAALGLSMSAIPAQATPKIPIARVPFNITGPGAYELVGNLFCNTPNVAAITISNITGPVILDFKGFTLTGLGNGTLTMPGSAAPGILINGGQPTINPNSVIIRNGTVTQFRVEVQAQFLGDLTIRNMILTGPSPVDSPGGGTGISLFAVNNSLISDCNITAQTGIVDNLSFGGNRYENVSL